MHELSDAAIPVLTDVISEADASVDFPTDVEMLVAELQTRLAADMFAMTEDLMRTAFAEMEAHLFEQVSAKLRQALPELIDGILREHLDTDSGAKD
jgi:hypothetical protein